MNKRSFVSLVVTVAMALSLIVPASAYNTENLIPQQRSYTAPFTDLKQDWYKSAVQTCYEAGLMEGIGSNRFNPGGTLSYAEILTITARLHSLLNGGDGKLPSPAPGEKWYQGAATYLKSILSEDSVAASYTAECLECMDDPYYADIITYADPCLRVDFVYFLASVLPEDVLVPINSISASDVPDFYSYGDEVLSFYNAGILTGTDKYGTFNGSGTLSRAEAAAMLARIIDPSQRMKFTPEKFIAAEAYLGLDPATPLLTVDGYTVNADLYLYWLEYNLDWYLASSLLPELFPEEYREFLASESYDENDPDISYYFECYLSETYGIDLYDLDWTTKVGKSGKTLAERILPIVERIIVENASVLNHEKEYPLTVADRAYILSQAGYAPYGFTESSAKADNQFVCIIKHIYNSCTPTAAEVNRILSENNCVYGMYLTLYRPESMDDGTWWWSDYSSDAEAKAAADKVRQQMQQHLNEPDYITYLMESYDEGYSCYADAYSLDMFSTANQRTLKNLSIGQVSPVLTEDDRYVVFYKMDAAEDEWLLEDLAYDAVQDLLDQWTDSAAVTTTEAYKAIDPNALFSALMHDALSSLLPYFPQNKTAFPIPNRII